MRALVELLKVNDIYKECMPYLIEIINEVYLPMEKEQLDNARPQIISNCVIKEISDEEIEKAAKEHLTFWRGKNHHLTNPIHADRTINDFKAAIKWYREQLKKI